MKNGLLAGLIGVSIVLSVDSITRVILSTYLGQEILMFSYNGYPGLVWPFLLAFIAGVSSFLGGTFSLTYGKNHRVFALISFLVFLGVLRYGQIHLLYETEGLFYPITALVFSLIALLAAWKVTSTKTTSESEPFNEDETSKPKHHQPGNPDS
ncbi:MAG TPA: hypothetical protein VKM37_08400 [Balneolaceae bacterium]|nr:hypothetical protein [Balneolaceae bacterium]